MSPIAEKDRRIKIFLVDDQNMLRAAFKSLLSQNDHFAVIGDTGDARDAIRRMPELRPDVVLLDITMPGLSGLDAIGPLREAWPRVRILMLTHHEGDTFVDQAMRAGADGYLSKDSDAAELAIAIEAVSSGRPFLSPKVAGGLVAKMRSPEQAAAGTASDTGPLRCASRGEKKRPRAAATAIFGAAPWASKTPRTGSLPAPHPRNAPALQHVRDTAESGRASSPSPIAGVTSPDSLVIGRT
jgi:DNA-binding NarL/FixJ family response regulator